MSLTLIPSSSVSLDTDACIVIESPSFSQFSHCFGAPTHPWPSIPPHDLYNRTTLLSHPAFSGQKLPGNPYLPLGYCPAGETVWEPYLTSEHSPILLHTPVCQNNCPDMLSILSVCLHSSMRLAVKLGCHSVQLMLPWKKTPCIPIDQLLHHMILSIGDILLHMPDPLDVYLYAPLGQIAPLFHHSEWFTRIQNYLYSNISLSSTPPSICWYASPQDSSSQVRERNVKDALYQALPPETAARLSQTLEQEPTETFQQMLFRFIQEKNYKETDIYKRANLDRRLFSKMRQQTNYQPSKNTILALSIALELNLHETQQFLEKSGFTLSRALQRDQIITFFIQEKIYNIFQINEVLFCCSLPLLGCNAAC